MTSARRIDLNADLGEEVGDDAAMLALVSSANIACGGHAGGPEAMFAAMAEAKRLGVTVGAHPGYADRANFGRVVVPMSAGEIERLVAAQVGSALGVAALAGLRLGYVKPHGALYNLAAVQPDVAVAVARAVRAVDPGLRLLCLSGSAGERVSRDLLTVAAEVFGDRGYAADGTLLPRGQPGAVIHDPVAVVARVRAMLAEGAVTAADGTRLRLAMDSICLHGDTPGAVELARALRATLESDGWTIAPFSA